MTPEASTMDPTAPPAHEVQLPRDRRGGLSFGVVIGVFATLLVLAIVFGFTIHRRYVAFERVAAHHVPPDATLVVRWDVEKVTLFEPTRRFLLPLLDASPHGHTAPSAARRDRFGKESGSVLGRELREMLVAFGPAPGDWSVLLAGSFASGDLVAAAERTLASEGVACRSLGAGRIELPGGTVLGQGADQVLVLASSAARLDAALATHPLVPNIPRLGAGAFVLRGPAGLPAHGAAWLTALGSPEEIRGEARWGNPLPLTFELRFAESPPPNVPERVRQVLGEMLGDDLARIERESGRVVIQPAGNRAFRVEVLLDGPALERAANRAAETVERALALGPAQD